MLKIKRTFTIGKGVYAFFEIPFTHNLLVPNLLETKSMTAIKKELSKVTGID